jgi:hypothetical protein
MRLLRLPKNEPFDGASIRTADERHRIQYSPSWSATLPYCTFYWTPLHYGGMTAGRQFGSLEAAIRYCDQHGDWSDWT